MMIPFDDPCMRCRSVSVVIRNEKFAFDFRERTALTA
jgi:hypothetical protein